MTISITFKLKEHHWDHGWIVTAFISKYLKAYFGNKASYYVCKLDVIEERLGFPKWQNTKR